MAEKQECFIIAPISTLAERTSLYLNDADHCEHVIEHLLVPAVEKAGFQPVRPKAKGANLIHAEIVRNLQTATLVLCDMSGLNPNVFFELGIRTAMNLPICLAIDEATKDPPFDLDLINHHPYNSDLRPWVLPKEIEKLANHIKDSATAKENALWQYFALRVKADTTEGKSGPDAKLDLLVSEFDALRQQLLLGRAVSSQENLALTTYQEHVNRRRSEDLKTVIAKARDLGLTIHVVFSKFGPTIRVDRNSIKHDALEKFLRLAADGHFAVQIADDPPRPVEEQS